MRDMEHASLIRATEVDPDNPRAWECLLRYERRLGLIKGPEYKSKEELKEELKDKIERVFFSYGTSAYPSSYPMIERAVLYEIDAFAKANGIDRRDIHVAWGFCSRRRRIVLESVWIGDDHDDD